MSRETDFESLVDTFYPSLYRFAFSLTRIESDARDLTQETFYIWATKGHQLHDARKVKSWLFTTLYHEYLARRRKMMRFPQLELEQAEDELPEVPATSLDRLDTALVLEALSRLNEAFQGPIALFYLEDYTYPEIAEILAIPLGTVKSRISRGLVQLQQMIETPQRRMNSRSQSHPRE
jgi:RNA polymerase sigma-70 factor (ECF subfamily)